jgi:hypothetical protein
MRITFLKSGKGGFAPLFLKVEKVEKVENVEKLI